jgi:hypothetical protein
MNIFSIDKEYREYGPNYGLPVINIQFGLAYSMKLEDIILSTGKLNLPSGSWVILSGKNVSHQLGLQELIKAMHFMHWLIELEETTLNPPPAWFVQVDRWILNYESNSKYNLKGLRTRTDLPLLRNLDLLDEFIKEVQPLKCLLGLLAPDPLKVWNKVNSTGIRVYKEG